MERGIQKSIFYKHEIDGIDILAVFFRYEYIKMAYVEKKNLFSRPSFGYIRFVMHLNENIWIRSVPIFTFRLYFFIYT